MYIRSHYMSRFMKDSRLCAYVPPVMERVITYYSH